MKRPPQTSLILTRILIVGLVGVGVLAPAWRYLRPHRDEAAAASLVASLKDPETSVARQAAETLGQRGPEAETAIPALLDAMADVTVRTAAERALVRLSAAAVPALRRELLAGPEARRRHAARVLAEIGPNAKDAVPDLLGSLKDADDRVRQETARALGRIGLDADAIAALATALSDASPWVVREAAVTLGRAGRSAESAVPALIAALERLPAPPGNVIGSVPNDRNRWVGEAVAEALGRIGRPALIPLLDCLAGGNGAAVALAGRAVRPMSVDEAVPPLIAVLGDKSPRRREAAARLLGEFGPDARSAVSALRQARAAEGPENDGVRAAAVEALRRIDSDTARLVHRVGLLFAQHGRRDAVVAALSQDANLAAADRALAIAVAQAYQRYPSELNNAAWNTVRARAAGPEAYALALRRAEAAVLLAPGEGNLLNTLGVAQYRRELFAEAASTLAQSDKIHAAAPRGSIPADLAFLALAEHRLGRKEQAAATRARLAEAMKKDPWAKDKEAQAFQQEVEEQMPDKR